MPCIFNKKYSEKMALKLENKGKKCYNIVQQKALSWVEKTKDFLKLGGYI